MANAISMYPEYGIERLRNQQGLRWSRLIDWVRTLPVTDPHVMALTLTLRRLRRTTNFHSTVCSDPLCAVCASEVLASYSGSEQDLLDLYQTHLDEIRTTVKTVRRQRRPLVAYPNVA